MIRPRHVKWLLLLFCIVQSTCYSYGQSAPTAKHRWSKLTIKVSDDLAKNYVRLPEADYTPLNQLESWSAKDAVLKYAAGVNGKFLLQYMLLVDEKGMIKEVEVIKADDAHHADALKALLLNTKTEGPSFFRNNAVTCYVPCFVKIEARQVTIH
ncbi:hypothetical protein [Chitinophaga cymbidii]|uniref:TonB C-terminal domain-containing protein n=1 Tax=Chitinophaga cymbidii TaxID=1096750 RepID=A0A512RRD6_9BACT|nr:hypothetical protein [Chitinophaga cymbidii]GEP98255.1 hypothetical protein CCY01nite_45150 [Chitinophaga cymbidii]